MKKTTKPSVQNNPTQSLEQIEDCELVIRAQNGDEKAFTELYNRFFPIVHRRVWNLVPAAVVDDVTQEVFLSVLQSLKSFRGEAKFSTWLYTLTSRQVANYYRKQERTPRQTDKDFTEYSDTDPISNKKNGYHHVDEMIAIRNGLLRLSSKYQNIILMRLVDGYKFKEIADLLEKSLDATKSQFRRALIALKQEIDRK